HSPAPATIVSSAWDCQLSPSPTEAAMPPCAQALEPDRPGRVPARTMLGMGPSFSAVNRPAMPAPNMRAPSVSTMLSMRFMILCFHRQHAVDRRLGAGGDVRRHDDFMSHGLKAVQNAIQGDALHVRAQVAGPHM